ncbi:hypothetical protein ABVF61_04235 [Roseibium sp. HPY-6]
MQIWIMAAAALLVTVSSAQADDVRDRQAAMDKLKAVYQPLLQDCAA